MINGLGVLGWGVGGIEAEAAMLGQPLSMLIPEVVGFRLTGQLREGATATDLVLTVTEMLRKKGVVGKFVEFLRFRPGRLAAGRSRHHRQHGSGIRGDLRHLPGGCRDAELSALHWPARNAGATRRGVHQGTGLVPYASNARSVYSDTLELDLGTVEPSLAGPNRPQDRVRAGQRQEVVRRRVAQSASRRRSRRAPVELAIAMRNFRRLAGPPPPVPHRGRTTELAKNCTTAPWSSPPSPAAPIPPILRSCWRPACWPRRRSRRACNTQAVGQNESGARLKSRDRLSRPKPA